MTDFVIPDTSDGLEELLNDADKLQTIVADGQLPDVVAAYARSVQDKDEGIAQQVKDETQRVLAEMLRDSGETDLDPALLASTGPVIDSTRDPVDRRQKLDSPHALGAKLNGVFDNVAEFFQCAWHANGDNPAFAEKRQQIRNSYASDIPSSGGFLIPEEFRSELLRVALETSIMRPRARTIPMGAARVAIPSIDSTSNATTVYGGISTAWTEEGATMVASEATFGRTVLDSRKLTAYAEVPNELLADSAVSFQALIEDLYPEAIAFAEDVAFISGSGAGEPEGWLNSSAAVEVAAEAGQAADTVLWENIVGCYSRMLPGSLGRAVWVANIDTFKELATMALSVGTGGSAIWLNNGAAGPPMTILGRPVLFTEKVPTLGDAGDISLIDPSMYLIGDRQAMSVASSEHAKFSSDVTSYRIIERLDGRSWLKSAITPNTGTATLSPWVKIAART